MDVGRDENTYKTSHFREIGPCRAGRTGIRAGGRTIGHFRSQRYHTAGTISPHLAPGVGMKLTPRQNQVLSFVTTYIKANGIPPTRVEIAYAFGFKSPNAAECHLRALAHKGFIRIAPGLQRNIQVSAT